MVPYLPYRVRPYSPLRRSCFAPPRRAASRRTRQRFASAEWYLQVGCLRPSTFLGHAAPMSASAHLTIIASWLEEANQRFEDFARDLIKKEAAS